MQLDLIQFNCMGGVKESSSFLASTRRPSRTALLKDLYLAISMNRVLRKDRQSINTTLIPLPPSSSRPLFVVVYFLFFLIPAFFEQTNVRLNTLAKQQ
jgi:hypothetical protein